ncbi:hypothetical protein IFU25_02265 [Pantoea agglomerans]|uniref:hypothetical protein n=1 Tax=Enterobacter agglomerans TaxID=549 RepID=UPI001784554C|nr:hypothetical protein [Pantoea agglomerans]MBD8180516.1 hypothetical protein [Pantoea agglomerans]
MNNKLDEAFSFYSRHIYDEEKIYLLRLHNLKVAGHVPSVLWELFGAILTGRHGKGATGADLQGWEVKSSAFRSSYEYQYHLNTGEAKLLEDCEVNHLFCSYSIDYRDLIVKAIHGSELKTPFFEAWLPEYRANYDRTAVSAARRQRFRKAIPYGFVQMYGRTILEVKAGEIYSRNDILLEEFNRLVG